MHNYASLFWTTVGRKLFTALFGLLLVGFVIGHLAGNLTIFMGPTAINEYAYFLEHAAHGLFLPVAEVMLFVMFAGHIVSALIVAGKNRSARSQGYVLQRDAGGASRKTLSSRTMAITGLVLLVFLVIHVAQFRLGHLWASDASRLYYTAADGSQVRNLYLMVAEVFRNPLWVAVYCGVMVLLGFHLRHGIWSAFQTLGAISPGLRKVLYTGGAILAVLLALGFFVLPIYAHLAIDPTATAVTQPGGAHR